MSIKSHLRAISWSPSNAYFFFLLSSHIDYDGDRRPAVTGRHHGHVMFPTGRGTLGFMVSTWLNVRVFLTLPSTPISRMCPVVFTAGTGGRAAPGGRRRAELTQKMRKIEEVCGSSPGTHRDAPFSFLLIS